MGVTTLIAVMTIVNPASRAAQRSWTELCD